MSPSPMASLRMLLVLWALLLVCGTALATAQSDRWDLQAGTRLQRYRKHVLASLVGFGHPSADAASTHLAILCNASTTPPAVDITALTTLVFGAAFDSSEFSPSEDPTAAPRHTTNLDGLAVQTATAPAQHEPASNAKRIPRASGDPSSAATADIFTMWTIGPLIGLLVFNLIFAMVM